MVENILPGKVTTPLISAYAFSESRHHAPVKSRVTVCEWENGTMEIHHRGQKLKSKEIEERSLPERLGEEASPREAPSATTRKKWRPGPDHPWRRGCGERNSARLALPRLTT